MQRAKETAEIIAGTIAVNVEFSDLFVERRRPHEVYHKPKNDPRSIEINATVMKNFHNLEYHFSDEENFVDLKMRAKKALELLAKRLEENILVVTHGFFMRMILAYALFGEDLTSKECEKYIYALHMENVGITILGYDEKNTNPWWLWVWNDHAHLD